MLPPEAIKQLKVFVDFVKKNPDILHTPELLFFKEFIEFFGGKLPASDTKSTASEEKMDTGTGTGNSAGTTTNADSASVPEEDDDQESEVELDNTGVLEEPDEVTEEPVTPDVNAEISEENIEKANEKKTEAISAFSDGDYDKAAKLYSEAIEFNPGLALLYAKRGQCFLKLNKPNACIRDCTVALLLNPDNAAAYKFRGRAHRLLGHWLEAAQDLRSACKIDCDEQADEWLKEVTPNAQKLEKHKLKYDRIRREKEIKEKQERIRIAREEHAKAAAANSNVENEDGDASNFGGFPFDDPELKEIFNDPEVAAAFQEISKDPKNFFKYMSNKKVSDAVSKLGQKFKGAGGGFPGFGGGFPFGGSPGGTAAP